MRLLFHLKYWVFKDLFNFTLIISLVILPSFNYNILFPSLNFIEGQNEELSNQSSAIDVNSVNTDPYFILHSFQTPKILFIIEDKNNPHPQLDIPFYNYMTVNLSFSVSYHDDQNQTYPSEIDAIVISQTIIDEGVVNNLNASTIPILTMEPGTQNEFQLGSNWGIVTSVNSFYGINSSHYITNGLPDQSSVQIYNTTGNFGYLLGFNAVPIGCQVNDLAKPSSLANHKWFRSLITLEKGENDWLLKPAPERRVFWGAHQGNLLNQAGWNLWERSLKWILYDDDPGSASITVNVKDKSSKNVENAKVTLINSTDYSNYWTLNTTVTGTVTFTDIPFDDYNIIVEYQKSINDSLTMLPIVSERTFQRTASFTYSIQIPLYLDNEPPQILNTWFNSSEYSFYADITDIIAISEALLNITVINKTSPYDIIINTNFSMVLKTGITYFNDTALDTLDGTNVKIYYNIIATDEAGNTRVSTVEIFDLEDPNPPQIHSYGANDFKNGTILFWANVTDDGEVESVTLRINNTFLSMFKNQSNYWIVKKNFNYDLVLNYTIWSAIDTLGNENGSKLLTIDPLSQLMQVGDNQAPQIWEIMSTFTSHVEGFVDFSARVQDWNIYQSQVNVSQVKIIFEINGENVTYSMLNPGGGIFYSFSYLFNYNDSVAFWIQATDLAGNLNQGSKHGPYPISDNTIPYGIYWAKEWGNGTVDFYSQVVDWPENQTSSILNYTTNYPFSWISLPMDKINSTFFHKRIDTFEYSENNIWFIISATDAYNNKYLPSLDEAKSIILTDVVNPSIYSSKIHNSTSIDCQIILELRAIDSFGLPYPYTLNNTYYLNYSVNGNPMISVIMSYVDYGHFSYTLNFSYLDNVYLYAWVNDFSGNQGSWSKNITILDFSAPKITNYNGTVDQTGIFKLWVEILENGSGLVNQRIILYVSSSIFYETLVNNGTKNIYVYERGGFTPQMTFVFFEIEASDLANNIYITPYSRAPIEDKIPPHYDDFSIIPQQSYLNRTHVNLDFWIEAFDSFGILTSVFVNISYEDHYSNYTLLKFGDLYKTSSSIIRNANTSYSFELVIVDGVGLTNRTGWVDFVTLPFNQAIITDFGIEYSPTETNQIRIWTIVNNSKDDVNLYLNASKNDQIIVSHELMIFNDSHYYFELNNVSYQSNITYEIVVVDNGVRNEYYLPNIIEDIIVVEDKWAPKFIGFDYDPNYGNNSILIWASVFEDGAGIENITIVYDFTSGGSGGNLQDWKIDSLTQINQSYYTIVIPITGSGKFQFKLIAYDKAGNKNPQSYFTTYPIPNIESGIDPLLLLIVFALTAFIFISAIVAGNIYRRKKQAQESKLKELKTKLNIPLNIYTLLVTSAAGIPIFDMTNVLYQRDESLNTTLSGVSVSIDTFLDSFQADFIDQFQQVPQHERSEFVRISVIEQAQVKILIGASQNYRMFIFFKEKPSAFARNIASKIIREIEEKLPLKDLGIIDDSLLKPQIKRIINSHLPLTLLTPFSIDPAKIKFYEAKIKAHETSPISMKALNLLKRIIVTRTSPNLLKSENKTQLTFYDKNLANLQILMGVEFLYSEVIVICKKALNASEELMYEALWIGASPLVNLLHEPKFGV